MANTYSDATGVLMFDGPAKITPVIRMLFKPFKLDDEPEDSGNEHYVAVLAEDNDYSWDFYLDEVVDAAQQAFGIDFQGQEEPADIIKMIGAHFSTDLSTLIDSIDLDNLVLLDDVAQLALSLADGHNLIGLCLEGCWHGAKPRLWEFGGWAAYVSKRYALHLSTSAGLSFARAMDAGLAVGPDQAAVVLASWIRRFINGIADEPVRGELVQRLGLRLNQADP